MRAIAAERCGQCLSRRYVNVDTKLTWRCARGHVCKTIPYVVLDGSWCPECRSGRRPPSKVLAEMRRVARERGGRCLARRYTRAKDDHEWECREGHGWARSWDEIRSGKWCPRCIGRLPPEEALAGLRAIARDRGGRCLSKRYVDVKTKLEWQCAEGHRWLATPSDIRSGRWCGRCAGNVPLTVEDMRAIAEERGGRCLSKEYAGSHVKHTWRCAEGHVFEMAPAEVARGRWCAYCRRRGSRGIQDFFLVEQERLARERGGRCLSRTYVDAQTPLRWRCQVGHEWEATPGAIVLGNWSPECAHTRRPRLEELRKIARERGGRCLSERYVNATTRMTFECRGGHRRDTRAINVRRGSWCPECARARKGTRGEPITIDELQLIAEQRQGRCLSDEYLGSQVPLLWRCRHGHEWEACPGSVRRGAWCPVCAGRVPLTIEDMRRSAANRGGVCLSDAHAGYRTKLEWRYAQGHTWWATPQTIRNGSWCPTCLEKAPDAAIARVTELARRRGGWCLSAQHHDPNKRLRWRCSRGHEWRAREEEVVASRWCPRCPE